MAEILILSLSLLVPQQGGRSSSKKAPVEMGTQNKRSNIDYSWLPEGTIPSECCTDCFSFPLCPFFFIHSSPFSLFIVHATVFTEKSPRNLSPRNRNSPRNRQRKQNSSDSTANVD